jgi:hypothetical protein
MEESASTDTDGIVPAPMTPPLLLPSRPTPVELMTPKDDDGDDDSDDDSDDDGSKYNGPLLMRTLPLVGSGRTVIEVFRMKGVVDDDVVVVVALALLLLLLNRIE